MANCVIKTGSFDYTFDPTPTDVTISLDLGQGQMNMDIPTNIRPYLYDFRSATEEITIKAMLLTSNYSTNTILKDYDDLRYIMSGEATGEVSDGMYYLEIPFSETLGTTARTYSRNTDASLDNGMFASANDYVRFVVFPKSFTIDKITANIIYVTLTFTSVQSVVSL